MDKNLVTIRSFRSSKWTHLNLTCLENKNLSWKAKAIHTYMISRPPDWQIKISDLINRATDGQVSLHAGINELIISHYIYRTIKRNDKRQILQHGFVVLEEPSSKPPPLNQGWEYKRGSENLQTENLNVGPDPPIIYNSITNKQEENSKQLLSYERSNAFSQSEKAEYDPSEQQDQALLVAPQSIPSLAKILRTRTKLDSTEIVDAEFIIDKLWNEQGIVKHRKGTRTHDELVRTINSLLAGKFTFPADLAQYNGKKFHRKDFVKSIKQFALAALHPDYEIPPTSSYKKHLQKTSLSTFIYNPYSTNGNKSLFLKYLENDAMLLAEKGLDDKNPALTDAIIEEYCRYQPNLKQEDLTRATFIKASNKLQQLITDNFEKISPGMMPTVTTLAKSLITVVFDRANGQMVPPHWLCAKHVFTEALPLYFVNQNVFREKRRKIDDRPAYGPSKKFAYANLNA